VLGSNQRKLSTGILLRQGLYVAQDGFELLDLGDSLALAFQVAGTTGGRYNTCLIFIFKIHILVKVFCYLKELSRINKVDTKVTPEKILLNATKAIGRESIMNFTSLKQRLTF
jgi:hypothetical protein